MSFLLEMTNPIMSRVTRLLLLAGLLAATSGAATQTGFIGSAACKACHPAEFQTFFRNPHFKSAKGASDIPGDAGCETCHGPGAAHVKAFGGKQTIRAFSQLHPEQVTSACLECHSRDVSRANIRSSEHTGANVVCTGCHSIHGAKSARFLLAKPQAELCYTCHQAIRAQFELPAHHRVNEGAMSCSDCHNPHGSFAASWRMGSNSAMLKSAFDVDQPCLRCHVDKRGPFVFEHASVRVEGCSACHFAHGSSNSRLLRRPVEFTLCLECHNGAGTFGRQNSGVFLTPGSHNLFDPRYQHCTLCHVRIHGSNSDATFLR